MSYDYSKMRPDLLTDEGQRTVCEALLDSLALAQANGLIPHEHLSAKIPMADSYKNRAVIERLIEMRYIQIAANSDMIHGRIYRWIGRSR
jgi:hypothetical protein